MAAQQKMERHQSAAGTFTMDDVREVLLEREQRGRSIGPQELEVVDGVAERKKSKKSTMKSIPPKKSAPAAPQKRSAASIVDILGFNPGASAKEPVPYERSSVDEKWLEHYDLLVSMRDELQERIATHRAETLSRDEGDPTERLRVLGQHTADGAADHADLERALTFVENERELLDEVVSAIGRIFSGTYGVCAQTGKPIDSKRLAAIPFARFSIEGQKEMEETRKRSAPQRSGAGTLFVDGGSDENPLVDGDDDGEE